MAKQRCDACGKYGSDATGGEFVQTPEGDVLFQCGKCLETEAREREIARLTRLLKGERDTIKVLAYHNKRAWGAVIWLSISYAVLLAVTYWAVVKK